MGFIKGVLTVIVGLLLGVGLVVGLAALLLYSMMDAKAHEVNHDVWNNEATRDTIIDTVLIFDEPQSLIELDHAQRVHETCRSSNALLDALRMDVDKRAKANPTISYDDVYQTIEDAHCDN